MSLPDARPGRFREPRMWRLTSAFASRTSHAVPGVPWVSVVFGTHFGRSLPRRLWGIRPMMTVHKLTAGDGYTYLTRQVASMDEHRAAGQSLADYYTARGNPPGIWIGAGAATLGVAGGVVSEAQMRALFGDGAHPDRDALLAAGAPEAATRLGARYPTYQPLPPRVGSGSRPRPASFEAEHGRPPYHGRVPADHRRRGAPGAAAGGRVRPGVHPGEVRVRCCGRSAAPTSAAAVEAAHHEAVADTLALGRASTPRSPASAHGGTAQVDTTRPGRRGVRPPRLPRRRPGPAHPRRDLEQGPDRRRRAVAGAGRPRACTPLGVAASERYNTRLEDALARRLGVAFADRPGRDPSQAAGPRDRRRPDPGWSGTSPNAAPRSKTAYTELAAEFRHDAWPGAGPRHPAPAGPAGHPGDPRRQRRPRAPWPSWSPTGPARPPLSLGSQRPRPDARDDAAPLARHPLPLTYPEAGHARRDRSSARSRSSGRHGPGGTSTPRPNAPCVRYRFATPEEREAATEAVVAEATGPGLSIRISRTRPGRRARPTAPGQRRPVACSSRTAPSATPPAPSCDAEERLVDAAAPAAPPAPTAGRRRPPSPSTKPPPASPWTPGNGGWSTASPLIPPSSSVGIGPAGAGQDHRHARLRRTPGPPTAAGSSRSRYQRQGRPGPRRPSSGCRAENLHKFLHEQQRATWDRRARTTARRPVVPARRRGRGPGRRGRHGRHPPARRPRRPRQRRGRGGPAARRPRPARPRSRPAAPSGSSRPRSAPSHLDQLHRFTDPDEAAATLALRAATRPPSSFYERS